MNDFVSDVMPFTAIVISNQLISQCFPKLNIGNIWMVTKTVAVEEKQLYGIMQDF